jgi:hypothetical protein
MGPGRAPLDQGCQGARRAPVTRVAAARRQRGITSKPTETNKTKCSSAAGATIPRDVSPATDKNQTTRCFVVQ